MEIDIEDFSDCCPVRSVQHISFHFYGCFVVAADGLDCGDGSERLHD